MESLIGFPGSVIARRGRVRDPFSTARVQAGAVEGFRATASLDRDGRAGEMVFAHASGGALANVGAISLRIAETIDCAISRHALVIGDGCFRRRPSH
jgi:hypothetical protein